MGIISQLKYASDRLKDDKDVVMTAVKNNGFAIQYASDRLKNDIEVVREASNTYLYTFDYVGNKFKEQFPTIKDFLDYEKEISNDNPWSKGNEDKANAWADKVNSDKASDLER